MALRLECLGGFAMNRDGAPVRVSARKARMLLGILAASRNRTLPRARLAAILWETGDSEQARTSLRQAIAQIRRAAGDGWLRAEDDALRLGPDVSTDLDAFRIALERNDTAEVVQLYRGPFLDGLDGAAPDLDQSIVAERARLAGLAARAFAAELDRIGDAPAAEHVANRLLGLDPFNEAAHRRLMRIDAARGLRGAARARYEALELALRRELDVRPEEETQSLYARLRRGAGGDQVRNDAPLPSTAPHPAPGFLLLALEGEAEPDWTALGQAAGANGAHAQETGPGEAAFLFTQADLQWVAAAALRIRDATAPDLAFGLIAVDPGAADASRTLVRARRLAALADPGEVLLESGLATRLGLAARPGSKAVSLTQPERRKRPLPPMVGREAELAQVEAAIAAARRVGRGLAIHVSGEAGIGKSRLASEIATRATASGAVACIVGFDAFSPGARHLAQRIAGALPVPPDPGPDTSAIDRAVWSWLVEPKISADAELRMSALGPEELQRRTLGVLADALTRSAGPNGLIVVVEDCHWAPVGAAEFLLDLLNFLADVPVVLLLTERPNTGSLDHRLAARARAGVVRLSLSPLPHAAARELVDAIAPEITEPDAAIDRAAGHPLFLIRLVEAGWTAGALPTSVTELVQEQIERLPPALRSALRQAAILGARFDPTDAAAIFPEASELRESGDLLYETEAGLAFGHDLIHRAIYDAISEETRQDWHARAAAHFRDHDPLRWADHALLGTDDAEASRAAAAAAGAMLFARRLTAAFPYIDAGLTRGGDAEAVAELHYCRAGIRRMRGDMAGALDEYRAGHAKAIRPETRATLLARQALVLHRLGRGDEADRTLDAAEEIADDAGLAGLPRALIHEQRGNRAFVRGDHAACLRHHQAALAAAETTGDPLGLSRGHGGIGDALYAAGRFSAAHDHFTRAIEIAETAGLGIVREDYLFMQAFSLFFSDPGPRAFLLVDNAVESAKDCAATRIEVVAREVRAEMRLVAGDLAGVAEDIRAIDALSSMRGEARVSDDVDILRVYLALRSGDLDEAKTRLAPFLPGARSNSDIGATTLGLATLTAEDREARDVALDAGLLCCEKCALSHSWVWFHALALERAIVDGDEALGRRIVAAMDAYAADAPPGLVSLYARTGELALWPPADGPVGEHAARLAKAGLGDMTRLLAIAPRTAPPTSEAAGNVTTRRA